MPGGLVRENPGFAGQRSYNDNRRVVHPKFRGAKRGDRRDELKYIYILRVHESKAGVLFEVVNYKYEKMRSKRETNRGSTRPYQQPRRD